MYYKTQCNIDWKITTKSISYRAGARCSNLCLNEKLQILNIQVLNKRTDLISKRSHAWKFLISKSDDKTEGPLSSVHKFDAKFNTFNRKTVDEKTVKIFFRPVCT